MVETKKAFQDILTYFKAHNVALSSAVVLSADSVSPAASPVTNSVSALNAPYAVRFYSKIAVASFTLSSKSFASRLLYYSSASVPSLSITRGNQTAIFKTRNTSPGKKKFHLPALLRICCSQSTQQTFSAWSGQEQILI